MDLKECPFCKSRKVDYVDYLGAISCEKCGAVGPVQQEDQGREGAKKLWNSRGNITYNFEDLEECDAYNN